MGAIYLLLNTYRVWVWHILCFFFYSLKREGLECCFILQMVKYSERNSMLTEQAPKLGVKPGSPNLKGHILNYGDTPRQPVLQS